MGIKQEINLVPDSPKKPHRGLWVAVISILSVAIIAIAITTIVINLPRPIEQQPEDASAKIINNLLTAENLSASGEFSFSPKYISGIEPTFKGEISLSGASQIIKVNNLNDLYNTDFHDQFISYLKTRISSKYDAIIKEKCSGENTESSFECLVLTDEELRASREDNLNTVTESVYNQIGQLINVMNGQWLLISTKDLNDTGILPAMDEATVSQIPTAINCTFKTIKNESSVSSLTELYKQYPFIAFSEADDNYHYLDLDFGNLANIIKSMPETDFGKEFTTCSNISLDNKEKAKFLARRLESESKYYPEIMIRLDDSNTYLSDIKLTADNSEYILSTNLKVHYSNQGADGDSEGGDDIIDAGELIGRIREAINTYTNLYAESLVPPEITEELPVETPEQTPADQPVNTDSE